MLVGNRYQLGEPLGKGGMGTVHEAVDLQTGQSVALKRLVVEQPRHSDRLHALFQREFHTLSRLSHPAVIEVYEYGVDPGEGGGPYYTMELLPGGDLRGAVPLPFGLLCSLLHDIASSLCLLHTRDLIHRDVTPRNIRMVGGTRAKLFDFGTLTHRGYTGAVVGTLPFVAPEAVFGQPLDGRSDLYSVGVVLYHGLSGKLPYNGKSWEDLQRAWLGDVVSIGELVPDLPDELERLTMSLLAIDRNERPRSAAEILERLAALADSVPAEAPIDVARAYLVEPELVARAEPMDRIRRALTDADAGRGGGVIITGPRGVGHSRLLDATTLESRMVGALVLRAGASEGEGAFAVAQALSEQLCASAPVLAQRAASADPEACRPLFTSAADDASVPLADRLVNLSAPAADRSAIIVALRTWFLAVATERCLVLAVDDIADIADIDEPSAAWLATLLQDAPAHRLLLVSAGGSGAHDDQDDEDPAGAAHTAIATRSDAIAIAPFDLPQTTELCHTLFGPVPNVDTLARRVFAVSRGRVRDAMALCEHLVDADILRYRRGSWLLPTEYDDGALPNSMSDALQHVARGLSPDARWLGHAVGLSTDRSLTLQHCQELCPKQDAGAVQTMLDALVHHGVLRSDGYRYRMTHRSWDLTSDWAPDELERRQAALRIALAGLGHVRERDPAACAHQLLLAGQDADGLAILLPFLSGFGEDRLEILDRTRLAPRALGQLLDLADGASRRLDVPRLQRDDLVYFRVMLGIYVDISWFEALRPAALADLKRDSGWLAWQQLGAETDPIKRVFAALQQVQTRYDATPAPQRSRSPEQAIRELAGFCAGCVAVGAQTADWPLRRSLPDLLRPFACLSPVIDAMLENCIAVTEMGSGQYEAFITRSARLLQRLSEPETASMEHVDEIRAAVTYGVAAMEARIGLPGALTRVTTLGSNPRLRSNALDLKAHILLQQGNWRDASACKSRVERMSLEGNRGQMFGDASLRRDLEVYAWGGDIGTVKYLLDRIQQLARKYPGWQPGMHSAEGRYEMLRGDSDAALSAFESCLAIVTPMEVPLGPHADWHVAAAGKVEALSTLKRFDGALEYGLAALQTPGSHSEAGIPRVQFHELVRAVAIAESRHGQHESAAARLTAAIAERTRLGTVGMQLGALHEASGYVALWAEDMDGYQRALVATRLQYMTCEDSAFAWRVRRLEKAARRSERTADRPWVPGGDTTAATGTATDDAVTAKLDTSATPTRIE